MRLAHYSAPYTDTFGQETTIIEHDENGFFFFEKHPWLVPAERAEEI